MSEISKPFFINLEYDSTVRFDIGRFMNFVDDNYDPLTSNILNVLQSLPLGGQYTVAGEEQRPDLISDRIYGDTQYWWLIMAYNGITSYLDIPNGIELRYPQVEGLEDFYFSLKVKQGKQDKLG